MTNLRKCARGEACEVRSPVCNYNPETTILAHYRLVGISGIGMKSPDLIAAHACSDCHDLVDGRRHLQGYSRTDVQLLHLQGVVRTQAKLIRRGFSFERRSHAVAQGDARAVADPAAAGGCAAASVLVSGEPGDSADAERAGGQRS